MTRTLIVDNRIESYGPFLTDDFTESVFKATRDNADLYQLVFALVADWRCASYAGALPVQIPLGLKGFHDSYVNEGNVCEDISQFAEATAEKVGLIVGSCTSSPSMKRKLKQAIQRSLKETGEVNRTLKVELDLEPLWQGFLKEPAFFLGLSGTLRLVLVGVYSAFENFVIGALKLAHGVDSLKVSDKEFRRLFREYFTDQLYDKHWCDSKLHAYRLVRHAFVHAGGQITEGLKKLKEQKQELPVAEHKEYLYVFPGHVQELYGLLTPIVMGIINAPAFSADDGKLT